MNDFDLMIAIGVLFMTAFALAFVLFFNFSQRKLVTQKLEQQEALIRNIIQTQETERQRIAKDLHDEIGSQLNIINLNLHRLKRKYDDPQIFEETIKEVQDLLAVTIKGTRKISHDLLPSTLENFGLIAAIQELCEQYSETNIKLHFEIQEENGTIADKSVELNIFRILQELISNSIRHGNATQITIRFWLNEKILNLTIEDNGKGFDKNKYKPGLGLSNIESRIKMCHGRFFINSTIDEGTISEILISKHDSNSDYR